MGSINDFEQYVIWKEKKRKLDIKIKKMEELGNPIMHLKGDPIQDKAMMLFAISNRIAEPKMLGAYHDGLEAEL